MRRVWILKGLKVLVLVTAAIAGVGLLVMALWNWLLPPLLGWPAIGFAQALALLVLCRVLFGGFRRRGAGHWQHRMRERWNAMTPEERERVRAGFGQRCGTRRVTPSAPP